MYAAVPVVVLRVVSLSHLLPSIATSCGDVERRVVVCQAATCVGGASKGEQRA